MKNIIITLLSISFFSCGIKKELSTLKTQHTTLENKYSELEKNYNKEKENSKELIKTKEQLVVEEKKVSSISVDYNKLKDSVELLKKSFPVMTFYKPHFSFGQIKMKSKNIHIFKFRNNGGSPLVITGVDVDCSCTVPKYPDYAIMPGEIGEIELEYIPSIPTGVQRKKIGILCNTLKGEVFITTYADVLDADKKKNK